MLIGRDAAGAATRRALLAAGLMGAGTGQVGLAQGNAAQGAGTGAGAGADWPTSTIRFINLYAPGGANDVACRIWCQVMATITGQQFVVENRTGAGGTVGTQAIARSAPDGLTLGLGSVATLAIAPSMFPSLPYDQARDFTFISGLYRQPNLLIVANDLPARTVPELIALLKREPGRHLYATGGSATTPHLTAEMFKTRTGTDMQHVPYRGGAPALIDVMAGRVPVLFDNFSGPIGAVRDGKVRALAVSGPQRSPAAPELPALAEFLPGFDITSWNGLVAPAGLPPAMVERISALTRRALAEPMLVRAFLDSGNTPWWTTAEDYASYRAQQEVTLGAVARASGARVE